MELLTMKKSHGELSSLFFPLLLAVSCQGRELFILKDEGLSFGEQFARRGFIELGNIKTRQIDYDRLYENFDRFIEVMSSDPSFAQKMFDMESAFLGDEGRKSRYCSAPPSYRDPRIHATKRFSKIYFQFIKEFYDICSIYNALPEDPQAREFLKQMRTIDHISKQMFIQVLEQLEKDHPGITQKVYGKHSELTVITKIVRYEETETGLWGTTPHVDKSALSLILNSDDAHDESLWICEDVNNPMIYKLHKPIRYFTKSSDYTSIILIPGAACLKLDIPIKPTVHGVAPIAKPFRHALISFLLIPDIDMSDIVTDFSDPKE
jgi:hypothetical protein